MEFNRGQKQVIDDALDFFYNKPSQQIFEFAGGPGTGKSVVMGEILRRIIARSKIPLSRIAPMAYTGAASIVMRLKGLSTARTIHSTLYECREVPLVRNGEVVMDNYLNVPIMTMEFVPRDLRNQLDIILIDEAGMVPASMLGKLLDSGAKIFACGDIDQLPPVEDHPAFLTDYSRVHLLTEIMRQAEGSAIVYLSQRAKLGLPIHCGWYGDSLVITDDMITDDMIKYSQVILCGRNKTRDYLNNRVRAGILGYHTSLPKFGEKVICRRNNWGLENSGINLTNGLTGTVLNNPDPTGFDGKIFRIDFAPDLMPECHFLQVPVSYRYMNADKQTRDVLRKSRYEQGNLFEYGYAQTVHLSQGSQWNNGMYFEEYLNREINNKVHYTAITRFANRMIYVKQRGKYM